MIEFSVHLFYAFHLFRVVLGYSTHCDVSTLQLKQFYETKGQTAKRITNRAGAPVGDKLNSLTVGPRGPTLMQDLVLIEELTTFARERIPERVVHAKGAGAFGYFEVTSPEIQKYCRASVFNKVGKKTPLFVRFSHVIPELGSIDSIRNPRGFAIKFYTDEGIWDLVGNNVPVFFVKDSIQFPLLIHSQKRNPKTHTFDWNSWFDFKALRPESLHLVSIVFSDRGIPDGYRHMHGHGINTFKLVNNKSEPFYCKFHYLTNQGIRNIDPEAAKLIGGVDPDYFIRDLYNSIENEKYPSWTMYVQIMTFKQAEAWYYNPFDATKVWPHSEFPLIEVGRIVLNKNPHNYFAQVEQVAFDPGNMPPGIEPSPDKLLQGRIFSYLDTQRYRLGPNFQKIPINHAGFQINTPTLRDGQCKITVYDNNTDDGPNYFPTSFSKSFTDSRFKESRFTITETPDVDRYEPLIEDNYGQVKFFWTQVLDDGGRKRLARNIASSLKQTQIFIQKRMLYQFDQVHPDYGESVREALKRANSSACP